MTTQKKGRDGGDRATPKTTDSRHYTGKAPLTGDSQRIREALEFIDASDRDT